MTTYKLTYFNLNALAEPIRWAFKVAEVDFEDERIEMENWAEIKESGRFPGKQMPLLEVDGVVYTQSNAILRYVGRKFGLVSNDELLNLRTDQVVDLAVDGRLAFRRFLMENDPEKKEEVRKELLTTICPNILKQLSDIVALTTDGDFIAGSKLTYGDLSLANWLSIWPMLDANLLDSYPVLVKQRDAVLALPQIKDWVAARPVTRL